MGAMNRNMNLPQIQKIMMEFEKESEIMDMKEEMMSDTIDEAMEEEEDEEEEEAIVNQVLDEIGINLEDTVSINGYCISHDMESLRQSSCGWRVCLTPCHFTLPSSS